MEEQVYLLQYSHAGLPEEYPFRAVLPYHAVSAARQRITEANVARSSDYPRLMRLEADGTLTLIAGPSYLMDPDNFATPA